MKKFATLLLGLSLVLGGTSIAFADEPSTTKTRKAKVPKTKKAKKTTAPSPDK